MTQVTGALPNPRYRARAETVLRVLRGRFSAAPNERVALAANEGSLEMVWVFAALFLMGFVLSVPFWKRDTGLGVTGGPVANFVGIPLAVIGLIGLAWFLFPS